AGLRLNSTIDNGGLAELNKREASRKTSNIHKGSLGINTTISLALKAVGIDNLVSTFACNQTGRWPPFIIKLVKPSAAIAQGDKM
ncbi:hypothetical protein, partial [Klebsiella pneumoniae]|uniref:hypothetical protein n=1 Tax=Klebsiella pneumoniae TaxID=573 RepID=UPI001D0F30D3